MQQSNQPAKFILPIAQNDASKADIPVTTADATRASQSLGFPPLTGQPPEAGGVPPQLPDMNGLLNAISRIPWWAMLGGRFGYDNAFATNVNINGYPLGAELASVDGLGSFFSTVDNNVSNPDANGPGWAPGFHYGATAVTGQTGGSTTLTQAQAAKKVITVSGTLTSNLVLIVPGWRYDWTVYNNTSGAFSVSVRTASGSAAAIPQNGAPTPVVCDGTNCSLLAPNFGPATSATQAARLDQVGGRLLAVRRFTASGTYTPTVGTATVVVELVGGGGAGGTTAAAPVGTVGAGGGGGAGAYACTRLAAPVAPVSITVGGGATTADAAGGPSSYGSDISASGGVSAGDRVGGAGGAIPAGATVASGGGGAGGTAIVTTEYTVSGAGASSYYGGGAAPRSNSSGAGTAGSAPGAGGSGAVSLSGATGQPGGNGAAGLVVIWEYA